MYAFSPQLVILLDKYCPSYKGNGIYHTDYFHRVYFIYIFASIMYQTSFYSSSFFLYICPEVHTHTPTILQEKKNLLFQKNF